jgi:hypothetical protein
VSAVDPASVGDRIEQLLEASAAAGPVARERAEELVRLVVELYGAGLERLLELAHDAGRLDDALLEALASDELVASLLLVHGLHPYGVHERVQRALDGARPALGDVDLLGVSEDGVVTVRVPGGHGCGSTAGALAVEEAVRAAAPEATRVDVLAEPAPAPVIPVASLSARLHAS